MKHLGESSVQGLLYCSQGVNRLTVIYSDATRGSFFFFFLGINVPTCEVVISNLMYKGMCRLDKGENGIIDSLLHPSEQRHRLYMRQSLVVEAVCAFDAEVFNCDACTVARCI